MEAARAPGATASLESQAPLVAELKRKIAGHEWPDFVVVEGPIGVGKTTLATNLAAVLGYPLLLEPALENPFLDRFYREQGRHALPTQLFFLLNRARQLADLSDNALVEPVLVSDYLMDKDRLFAEVTLDENEMRLYQEIYENLDLKPPRPNLVIYLQAPVDMLLDRIRRRGIEFEQQIDPRYIESIAEAYAQFFHFYDRSPLLVVNAAEIDFAGNSAHLEALLDCIRAMEGGRQYFNPNPSLL